MYGERIAARSVREAIALVTSYDETLGSRRFERYEIAVRFSNDDHIRCEFREKRDVIEFLEKYELDVCSPNDLSAET